VTKLFFAGAEQPSHRNLLIECGVERFALNLTNLDRIASKNFDVDSHLPDGALWIVYADLETTWEMAEPFIEQQPYMVLGPITWAKHFEPGAAFGPFWSEGVEPNVWPIVGLTDDTVKASVTLRRIMNQYTASILCAVTGATKGVERLDMVVSYAWLMAQRFGETQVWAGNKLHRYAGNRKAEARPKHRADIERLGVDYSQVLADDPVETSRLAIRSWQEWEERYTPRTVVPLSSNEVYSDQDGTGSSERRLALVDQPTGHQPGPGGGRAQILLPGLEMVDNDRVVTDGDGVQRTETMQTIITLGTSFRQCNTCYLAATCPAHQLNATCAFNIPVEARTKDQIQAICQAGIEMQMQRVAFARYGEQLDGQGVDAALSAEMDRLFSMMAKMKDILDDSATFRFSMEAKANGGVLSRLFGEGVGTAARALPIPVSSDEVLRTLSPDDSPTPWSSH
jgi:hypothetical protein